MTTNTEAHVRMFTASEEPIRAAVYAQALADAANTQEGAYILAPSQADLEDEGAMIAWVETEKFEPLAFAYTARASDHRAYEIRGVFTMPNSRKRGYAEQAVRALLEHLRGLGEEEAFLTVRVTDDGMPTAPVSLYEKLGFRLMPGTFKAEIGYEPKKQHLRRTADPDGRSFRFAKMVIAFRSTGAADAR
ncbi:MAG: GNAT family N-acetyltransferase [Paracoccaceae bacterium]